MKQTNNHEIKDAKIIYAGGNRIWLTYMNGFKGAEFEITGYTNAGKEVYKFTDTIPWNVEQKPLKSPYQ